jgi:hypothetical protein
VSFRVAERVAARDEDGSGGPAEPAKAYSEHDAAKLEALPDRIE